MPQTQLTRGVARYGVLVGQAVASRAEVGDGTPHYQILLVAQGVSYRVAVNVRSSGAGNPNLMYLVDDNFQHPNTSLWATLEPGFHSLNHTPESGALDFIRGNLFDVAGLRALPDDVPGPDNDLNEKLEFVVGQAIRDQNVQVYAFGSRWGPEDDKSDKVFQFRPGNGTHNIHMNQGNPKGRFFKDNGVWQDGALFLHFPATDRWVAVFLAFQSQAMHTDDATGAPFETEGDTTDPLNPKVHGGGEDKRIRLIVALVNPTGVDDGKETVTLINATSQAINMDGWMIADAQKKRMNVPVSTPLAAGETRVIRITPPVHLGNNGGFITLLDERGLKVDGVKYSKRDARPQGVPIIF